MKRTAPIAACLVLSAWSIAARADNAPATGPASTNTAAAHKAATERWHHGIELYKKATQTQDPADFEKAYVEFAQAYAVYPDDKVLWNLGASELETKRYLSALKHFRLYDAHLHVSDDAKHPDHAKLAQYLDRSYGATGHLDIKANAGAHVSVDGADQGTAPLATIVDVDAGTHQVAADQVSRSVDATAGTVVKVAFDTTATTTVVATTSTTPVATTQSNVAPPVDHDSATTSSGPPLASWILAGVGVVGIGVGIGAGLAAKSKDDDVANAGNACAVPSSSACGAVHDSADSRNTLRVVDIAGFAVGGASLIGAGVLWFLKSREQHSASTSGQTWVTPVIGAGQAGMSFGKSF